MKCASCQSDIPNYAERYYEVKGWGKMRKDGGLNHLALQRRTGRVACIHCVNRVKAGVPAKQMEMS